MLAGCARAAGRPGSSPLTLSEPHARSLRSLAFGSLESLCFWQLLRCSERPSAGFSLGAAHASPGPSLWQSACFSAIRLARFRSLACSSSIALVAARMHPAWPGDESIYKFGLFLEIKEQLLYMDSSGCARAVLRTIDGERVGDFPPLAELRLCATDPFARGLHQHAREMISSPTAGKSG